MKQYAAIIAVISTLVVITGGVFGAFTVFATNERVNTVEQDLREYKLINRLHALEERVWAYDKQYGFGCKECPPEAINTYRQLKQEIKDIERKLEKKG